MNQLLFMFDLYSQWNNIEWVFNILPEGDKDDSLPMDFCKMMGCTSGWDYSGHSLTLLLGALS